MKTTHATQDLGVASQIGSYSDAVTVSPNMRWLFSSGTPGLEVSGALPADIAGQAEIAWKHILTMLDNANMSIADIVKATQYLTRSEDVAPYVAVRKRIFGDARPAFTLLVIPQLVRPEFLVEIEIIAARPMA
jgi:enamine deaminase RidA (YjgF/YER057c/UK114 family)